MVCFVRFGQIEVVCDALRRSESSHARVWLHTARCPVAIMLAFQITDVIVIVATGLTVADYTVVCLGDYERAFFVDPVFFVDHSPIRTGYQSSVHRWLTDFITIDLGLGTLLLVFIVREKH